MTNTLVQALEGISFPCDRSQIVEYARTKGASSHALGQLEALPEGRYGSMTDLFTALPSKSERRKAVPRPPTSEDEDEDEDEDGAGPDPSEVFNPMQLFGPWQSMWVDWMNSSFETYRRFWTRR